MEGLALWRVPSEVKRLPGIDIRLKTLHHDPFLYHYVVLKFFRDPFIQTLFI
jgi:hypothetical protein